MIRIGGKKVEETRRTCCWTLLLGGVNCGEKMVDSVIYIHETRIHDIRDFVEHKTNAPVSVGVKEERSVPVCVGKTVSWRKCSAVCGMNTHHLPFRGTCKVQEDRGD